MKSQEDKDLKRESKYLSKDQDTEPSLIQIKARTLMREGLAKVEETSGSFAGFDPERNGFIGNNHNGGQWVDAYNRVIPKDFADD